jgi:hypothetical protein
MTTVAHAESGDYMGGDYMGGDYMGGDDTRWVLGLKRKACENAR